MSVKNPCSMISIILKSDGAILNEIVPNSRISMTLSTDDMLSSDFCYVSVPCKHFAQLFGVASDHVIIDLL